MRRIIFSLLLIVCLGATGVKPAMTLHFENSNADSIALNPYKYQNSIIVYTMEPACTGCKDNLAISLKSYSRKKCKIYAVGNNGLSVENRKQAEIFLNKKFPYLKQVLFMPASGVDKHMAALDTIHKKIWHKTPYVVAFNSSNQQKCFIYDSIFNGMAVRASFTEELNRFLKKR